MNLIPVLTDIYNGLITSLQNQFGITIPANLKNYLKGLAGAWSSQVKSLYRYIASVQKNVAPDTADSVTQGGTLERFGNIYLQRNPFPATEGQYIVSVSGNAGAVIDAGTQFSSDPASLSPGYLFQLDTTYTLTGSGDTITLRALTGGTIANLVTGNTLTCVKPLANINMPVTVTSVSVNAIDAETIPQYRKTTLLHMQLAPQGGASPDYRIWGSDVDGVANIYPYTASGAVWETDVYVEAIASDSTDGYGTPSATILNNVTAAILADPATGLARKPMGVVLGPANVGALAVTIYQVTISFMGTTGMTTDQKTLIKNALAAAISNIRPFIAGCDPISSQNDTLSINLPASSGSQAPPEKYIIVSIATAAAPGAVFTHVSMTINGASETLYTFTNGIIPYLIPTNVIFI